MWQADIKNRENMQYISEHDLLLILDPAELQKYEVHMPTSTFKSNSSSSLPLHAQSASLESWALAHDTVAHCPAPNCNGMVELGSAVIYHCLCPVCLNEVTSLLAIRDVELTELIRCYSVVRQMQNRMASRPQLRAKPSAAARCRRRSSHHEVFGTIAREVVSRLPQRC